MVWLKKKDRKARKMHICDKSCAKKQFGHINSKFTRILQKKKDIE